MFDAEEMIGMARIGMGCTTSALSGTSGSKRFSIGGRWQTLVAPGVPRLRRAAETFSSDLRRT